MAETQTGVEMGEKVNEGQRGEGFRTAVTEGDEEVTMTGIVAGTVVVGMRVIKEGVEIGEGTPSLLLVKAIGIQITEIVPGTGMGDETGGIAVIVIGVVLNGEVDLSLHLQTHNTETGHHHFFTDPTPHQGPKDIPGTK